MTNMKMTNRLYSLDAIRGFDMLWIMGVDIFFHKLANITNIPIFVYLSNQLKHPDWNGFTFYDLIFPLFIFLSGISMVYSVNSQIRKGKSKIHILKKIVNRAIILVLLGLIYNNGITIKPIEEIRFGSVLSRIGLAYMFAGIIYLYTNKTKRLIINISILIFYWLLFVFFSSPGYEAGDISMQGNIVSYLDRIIMPGKLYLGIHDPEGLISTIPAISTALIGIYVGEILKFTKKVTIKLIYIGITLIVLAQIWNLIFPINKNLWTSSFVLQCGGISVLLMAIFHYVIDVKGYKSWAFFFKVIGMNSIFIYMSVIFIGWTYTNLAIFGFSKELLGQSYGDVFLAFSSIVIKWLLLYLMYTRNFFLKI